MTLDVVPKTVAALEGAGLPVAVRDGDITPPVVYLKLGTATDEGGPLEGSRLAVFYVHYIPIRGVDNLAGDADALDVIYDALAPIAWAALTATSTTVTVKNIRGRVTASTCPPRPWPPPSERSNAMPTTVNKLVGTLKLGDTATGKQMEAQVAQVGTPQTVTRDAAVTVLTGDVIQASATYSWALTGQVLLDLSDPHRRVLFREHPPGPADAVRVPAHRRHRPAISGTVIVDGWDTRRAGRRVDRPRAKFTWPMQGSRTSPRPPAPNPTATPSMPNDTVGVDIKNQAAFTACLDAIRKSVDEPDTALNAAGRELVTAAAAAAPKATGRLRQRPPPATGRRARYPHRGRHPLRRRRSLGLAGPWHPPSTVDRGHLAP